MKKKKLDLEIVYFIIAAFIFGAFFGGSLVSNSVEKPVEDPQYAFLFADDYDFINSQEDLDILSEAARQGQLEVRRLVELNTTK